MSSEIAIQVEHLSKCYPIYAHPRDRLKQFVLPRLRRLFSLPSRQYYREFWALRDVSFEVRKGETVGIIGRNGSGKSTLLQLICGTLNPTGGTILTHGRIAALLELGSGFNPEFTGIENVYSNGAILGLTRDEIDARFSEIAEFADIGDFIERPIKTYSSGMIVRLAFAVQAAVDPEILIIDEALAVGDEKFQRKCFGRLEHLKSKGSSILFVSHSPASITELCDRTLLLDQGCRLMYSTAPATVRAYQKLLYSPRDEAERLIAQYRAVDRFGETQELLPAHETCVPAFDASFLDGLDDTLVPETTIAYPAQGAEIKSIRLRNGDGRSVNVLRAGGEYKIDISGDFMDDFSCVFFGVHIRTVSGVVVSGQRYPGEGSYLENIRSGKSFRVTFSMRMDLLPGVYFIGSGVWSTQEPNCLHRILDALMFRVLPTNQQVSFGYVNLATEAPDGELL